MTDTPTEMELHDSDTCDCDYVTVKSGMYAVMPRFVKSCKSKNAQKQVHNEIREIVDSYPSEKAFNKAIRKAARGRRTGI